MNFIFGIFLLLVSPSLGQVDNIFASFIAKICLSDSDCGKDEQCQLPFAGALAGLPKSPLILAIQTFSLRTCGPRLSPPARNTDIFPSTGRVRADGFFIPADESMDGFYQAPPFDAKTSENLFGQPLNAIVPDLGLGLISAPSIVCRAFQRDLNVGDSIGINAIGFANDLFNVTIPDGVSADTILVHVKELQTMVKVPGTFQFTCDAPGAFSLKFKVFVTDVDGGFLGKGYRTCKSLITCSLPLSTIQPTTLSDQNPNVVIPAAWQLPPPGYPKRLTQSYGPGAPPYGIPGQLTDPLPGARIPLGTVSQRQIDELPENQSEDVYRNMFLAYEESAGFENRADIAKVGALETEVVVERAHESVPPKEVANMATVIQAVNPPEITCHDLSVDAKLHRDIALSLPGSLYSIKTGPGKTAKTKVLIPGYDGDASIFPYKCTEPGLVIQPAAILAELEGLNDFKHCPLKINCVKNTPPEIQCRNDPLVVVIAAGETVNTEIQNHSNSLFHAWDPDGDSITTAVQDTKTAQVKFTISHSCSENETVKVEQYLITAFDGEDFKTAVCSARLECSGTANESFRWPNAVFVDSTQIGYHFLNQFAVNRITAQGGSDDNSHLAF